MRGKCMAHYLPTPVSVGRLFSLSISALIHFRPTINCIIRTIFNFNQITIVTNSLLLCGKMLKYLTSLRMQNDFCSGKTERKQNKTNRHAKLRNFYFEEVRKNGNYQRKWDKVISNLVCGSTNYTGKNIHTHTNTAIIAEREGYALFNHNRSKPNLDNDCWQMQWIQPQTQNTTVPLIDLMYGIPLNKMHNGCLRLIFLLSTLFFCNRVSFSNWNKQLHRTQTHHTQD